MRFDFNEINILRQNFFSSRQKKEDFLELLQGLLAKTDDYILKDSIESLTKKISSLSAEEFTRLREDSINKRLVATMNKTRA